MTTLQTLRTVAEQPQSSLKNPNLPVSFGSNSHINQQVSLTGGLPAVVAGALLCSYRLPKLKGS